MMSFNGPTLTTLRTNPAPLSHVPVMEQSSLSEAGGLPDEE